MYAGAKQVFQPFHQLGVAVEIHAKGWTRFLGMDQPDLNPFTQQISDDFQEGYHLFTAFLHIQVLQV